MQHEYEAYHKHTYYSNVFTSDSTVSLSDYANRAKKYGQKVLCSLEHGWQGNYYQAYTICKANDLKLVIGAEAYWVKDRTSTDKSNCHIVILAKNERGRRALNLALSEANLSGFYYRPRLDIPLILSLPKDDVIVTTACIAYWKYDDIDDITRQFAQHFGKNFFLEVQPHNNEKQAALNAHILALRSKLGCSLIAGTDSHFIDEKDASIRDDFLLSKSMQYDDENGWFMDYPDAETLYCRFANQAVLSHDEIVEAMQSTLILRDVEEYDSPVFNDDIKMPTLYPDYTQEQRNEEYLKLVYAGWDEYKVNVPEEKWPDYLREIEYETQTVCDTGMADYFIDNYYIIKKGIENGGMLTRTGRGSGCSYLTNKLLGFSDIDRVSATVHLYPDRFMSKSRVLESKSLADIDHNEYPVEPFAKAQKEVLGEEHSYPMLAYGTLKASAAWKLYAKAQGVPFEIANEISERIKRYELAVKHADEDEKDSIDIVKFIGSEFEDTYQKSKDYLGVITSWSIHPCSYLIYSGDIKEEVGLVRIKDHIVCLMDGKWGEAGHFLKQDHLCVNVVQMIYAMFRSIGREPPTVKELLDMCPPDDEVWNIYERACCLGINQVEKEATSARVAKYKPHNIAELTAFVAAIRPGFASLYKKFENREHYSFGIESLDSLLQTPEMPESWLLYQESIMAVLNYAGIPMGECYTAIKNIAKKRAEKVLAYQQTFRDGMRKRLSREGYSNEKIQETCDTVWQTIEDAASYSYNASHAYCVALDSLYCAWFKAHYPMKFYEQYIRIQETKGDKDKINAAKEEAESHFGIRFAPLRFGQDNRTIHADEEKNEMINTMGSIKGYGVTIGRTFYDCSCKGFTSFIDVLSYLDKNKVKEAKFKPLILIDYFEQFGNQRELLRIAELWDMFKQGEIKSIKRTEIDSNPILKEIVQRYTTSTRKDGKDAALYTFNSEEDVMKCLYDCEKAVFAVGMQDLDMRVKIQNCVDILGYCDIRTGKEEDRRRLLVTEVFPLKTNGALWAYRLATKSLGSGKTARVTVKTDLYNRRPINEGDIIYAAELYKNKAGYWYISDYRIEV